MNKKMKTHEYETWARSHSKFAAKPGLELRFPES